MTHATFDVRPSARIMDTIIEAIGAAQEYGWHDFGEQGALISFKFNGVTVSVRADSDVDLIYRDWHRALNGYIKKRVGPYPKVDLSDEEKANDARIEAENERARQEHQAAYEATVRAKRERVEARLEDAPQMEISNEAVWQDYQEKNQDGYGGGIIAYAECWARLMQLEIAEGKTLEEVADATSHEADLDGITGFMYGAAVHTLSQCWTHGDELRKWHNKKYGASEDEEGTVNPALITVSLPGPR